MLPKFISRAISSRGIIIVDWIIAFCGTPLQFRLLSDSIDIQYTNREILTTRILHVLRHA